MPTLVGCGGLVASYQLLLGCLRFRAATLAWLLVGSSPAMLIASVSGRGYGCAYVALVVGLLASVQLLRAGGLPRRRRRRAWLWFGLSGVLGLYAVPTHLYGLLGLLGGLGIGFSRLGGRRGRLQLLHLALVSAGMGGVVGVLYSPLIAVTGWDALVHNPYVQAVPRAEFWYQLRGDYLPAVAGILLGWPWVSGALFAAVALVAPVLLGWGRLPAPTRCLGWLAYGQLVGWLGFMQLQQVLPPARTLLIVPVALVVLGLMSAQWAVANVAKGRLPRRLRQYGFLASLLLVGAVGAYRLRHYSVVSAGPRRASIASFQRVQEWLRPQQPHVVWVESLPLLVYLRYEALRTHQKPLPIRLVAKLPPVKLTEPGDYLLVLNLPADQPACYRVGAVAIVAGAGRPAEAPDQQQ